MRSHESSIDVSPAKIVPRLGEDRYDNQNHTVDKKNKRSNNNSGNLITINGKGFEVS